MENKAYGKDLDVIFTKLKPEHRGLLSSFSCGNESIDEYFKNEVTDDKTATTYLFLNKYDSEIITMFTIQCSGIVDTSRPTYKDIISAIEIVYFSTDEKYQGMRYSENREDDSLSHQFLLFCVDYIKTVPYLYCGASKLILYSVPEKVNFYLRGGFQHYSDYMEEKNIPYLEGCVPMFLSLD